MLKTYDVKCGTVGIMDDGKKILFPTEQEAEEYYNEIKESEDSQ